MALSKHLHDGSAGYPTKFTLKPTKMRFSIRNNRGKIEKEGDLTVRYTGSAEPYSQTSERECKQIGTNSDKSPKLLFTTGLDEKNVQFYHWYTNDEKAEVKKQIKELRPKIAQFYGGDAMIDAGNNFFWRDNRDIFKITVTNKTEDIYFDTDKHTPSALLYLSIIGGAFSDTIAPTKEWADKHQIPFYMILESEEDYSDDVDFVRSDAHAALSALKKDASPEALFILAWCIQYDTHAYGAYLKSTSFKDLVSYHMKYIDGKLSLKKKRNTPKVFLEYADKWNSQQMRPLLYAEAYVKAGEYYNFIVSKDKQYTMIDGLTLGGTVPEAVETLMSPKNREDFERLRDQVEKKWLE